MENYLPIFDSDEDGDLYQNLSYEEIENKLKKNLEKCDLFFLNFHLYFKLFSLHKKYIKQIKQTDSPNYIYNCYMVELRKLLEKEDPVVMEIVYNILKLKNENSSSL